MSTTMYNWSIEEIYAYINEMEYVDYRPEFVEKSTVSIDWDEVENRCEPIYDDPTLHPMYGQKHTEESRELIRLSKVGRKRTDYERQRISEGKTGLSRKPFTEEHKNKIRESNKGVLRSAETRARMSESRKGHKHSEETLLKLKTPKSKITCRHCGKTGGSNGMKRYHFDNCKSYGTT